MEEIYTVHVKCRPDPAHNYPSERAYSSSTVGGLATTHFLIAILVTTLTTASYCSRSTWIGELISGATLISGAILCALTGLLASKRWYIDRYIRWFFIASVISTICSVLSLSLMTYYIIRPTFNHHAFMFFYLSENNFNNSHLILPIVDNNTDTINDSNSNGGDIKIDLELIGGETIKRYKRGSNPEEIIFQIEIYIHLLLASLVEIILAMFSIKIGWKGVKNSSQARTLNKKNGSTNAEKPIRPDILENHKNGNNHNFYNDSKLSNYSNVVKELYKLQKNSMLADNIVVGNRVISKIGGNDNQNGLSLPLPESQKEYRERIEKFLASNDNCLKE